VINSGRGTRGFLKSTSQAGWGLNFSQRFSSVFSAVNSEHATMRIKRLSRALLLAAQPPLRKASEPERRAAYEQMAIIGMFWRARRSHHANGEEHHVR
jgi:hypothetical protein